MPVRLLTADHVFPPVTEATPEGILAVGGDLQVERLLLAYRSGIFPWYGDGDPIIWWSPDPRFVLFPPKLRISSSMQRLLRRQAFEVTFDRNFEEVIAHCRSMKREGQGGTWITREMQDAYCHFHEAGYAHSVEVWQNGNLVGGLYGVSVGACYFGESMFTRTSNASKYGLVHLVRNLTAHGFILIDCQVHTRHLQSLGAESIPRARFMDLLEQGLQRKTLQENWGQLFGASSDTQRAPSITDD